MIGQKKVLALIPARGGSKRLPRKNVLDLAGKPLIAWSIEAATTSKYVDTVIVSTDDEEILVVSEQYGAKVPFKRPADLASDAASTNDVVLHSLEMIGEQYDIIVVLQPTSPLRSHVHLDESLELMKDKAGKGVVSVSPCEHSPMWSNTLPSDCSMKGFVKPEALVRSQELETFYRLNGAIYAYEIKSLAEQGGIFYTEDVFAYVMQSECSVDIDTKLDFKIAEILMEAN